MAVTKSLFCSIGDEDAQLNDVDIKHHLFAFLATMKDKKNILIIPPDYTRYHSQAGRITQFIHEYYKSQKKQRTKNESEAYNLTILPALGTHAPMTQMQIKAMFGDDLADMKPSPFVVHDWRKDVTTVGHVPAEMVKEATYGLVNTPWPAQLNTLIWPDSNDNEYDLILSVGQVVPHEVMGMANFNKNIFVGVGGVEAINLSHFIGAVHGMEKLMGQANNPLRSILNYASEHFLQNVLPLWYILTVMGTNDETGDLEIKGFYIGNDIECYNNACELSLKVNFTMLDASLEKVIVYLDPDEFHSTWLGNKAIYRTRMAIADGGHLIILAPGVNRFGEDDEVDLLIRKYGYKGTEATMKCMKEDKELQENLSAVAHLIHGSSEGRFRVTYCPGHLSKEEIEKVGYEYMDLKQSLQRYNIQTLKDGWNTLDDGEEIYYISNPALGLWAVRSRFDGFNENTNEKKNAMQIGGEKVIKDISVQNGVDQSGGVGGWKKSSSS